MGDAGMRGNNLQLVKARQRRYKARCGDFATVVGSPCPAPETALCAIRPAKRDSNAIGWRDVAIAVKPSCRGSRRTTAPTAATNDVSRGNRSSFPRVLWARLCNRFARVGINNPSRLTVSISRPQYPAIFYGLESYNQSIVRVIDP